ncbi:MAG: CHASE domain-containing protein [Elainellaceae cyanobacterium]
MNRPEPLQGCWPSIQNRTSKIENWYNPLSMQQTDRRTYGQAVQAEGYPTFHITELSDDDRLIRAGDRPYYIPVTYITPFIGYDAVSKTVISIKGDRTQILRY